jgi:hypothetical protein
MNKDFNFRLLLACSECAASIIFNLVTGSVCFMHTFMHTYIHIYTHACMHTYIHNTYIHTYIRTMDP